MQKAGVALTAQSAAQLTAQTGASEQAHVRAPGHARPQTSASPRGCYEWRSSARGCGCVWGAAAARLRALLAKEMDASMRAPRRIPAA